MKALALVSALALLAGCAVKPVQELTDEELTSVFLIESGIHRAIRAMPQTMSGALQEKRGKLPTEIFQPLHTSFVEAFSPEVMMPGIRKDAATKLTRQERIELVQWFPSQTGGLILYFENVADAPNGQADQERWARALPESGPPADDVELATEILKESGEMKLAVSTVSAVPVAMMMGVNLSLPEGKRVKSGELAKQSDGVRAKIAEAIAPALVQQKLWVLSKLSAEQKAQYRAFTRTPVSRRYSEFLTGSLVGAFTTASMQVGNDLGRALASLKK
jgi:hypothetical protein